MSVLRCQVSVGTVAEMLLLLHRGELVGARASFRSQLVGRWLFPVAMREKCLV